MALMEKFRALIGSDANSIRKGIEKGTIHRPVRVCFEVNKQSQSQAALKWHADDFSPEIIRV